MPYSRKTLTELKSETAQDISVALPGADPLLRYSNLGIIGRILAGLINLVYGYLDWISRMAVPFTAMAEYLIGWGSLKNVTIKAATFAGDPTTGGAGSATFNGNPSPPITIHAGTPLVRGDQAAFVTTADGTTDGSGNVTVPVKAVVAGALGNTPVSSILTLGIAIAGMNSNGVVSTAITGGNDQETMDAYRTRVLEVYANTPQGGALADYKKWALEVPGVTRAWPVGNGMGVGTVVVYTMFDVTEAIHNGFPQGSDGTATAETRAAHATGDQLAVANYIYGDINTARQPVTALVYSVSPIANAINFVINGIATASASVKAQISAAIAGVFVEQGAPGGIVYLSDIESAIAAIPGTEGFVITTPSGNITNPTGNLPVLGTVTYT